MAKFRKANVKRGERPARPAEAEQPRSNAPYFRDPHFGNVLGAQDPGDPEVTVGVQPFQQELPQAAVEDRPKKKK